MELSIVISKEVWICGSFIHLIIYSGPCTGCTSPMHNAVGQVMFCPSCPVPPLHSTFPSRPSPPGNLHLKAATATSSPSSALMDCAMGKGFSPSLLPTSHEFNGSVALMLSQNWTLRSSVTLMENFNWRVWTNGQRLSTKPPLAPVAENPYAMHLLLTLISGFGRPQLSLLLPLQISIWKWRPSCFSLLPLNMISISEVLSPISCGNFSLPLSCMLVSKVEAFLMPGIGVVWLKKRIHGDLSAKLKTSTTFGSNGDDNDFFFMILLWSSELWFDISVNLGAKSINQFISTISQQCVHRRSWAQVKKICG